MHAAISVKVRVRHIRVAGFNDYVCQKQQDRAASLETEIEVLEKELGEGRDAQAIVKRHIGLLHKYNEAKDATQILIGRLASLKETTVRQIHEDYDLIDTD
ncbi:hypothetical protein FA15DRAFT_592734 [Coprinopsis marcescibilis]|uniref:Swi5-domain-containing protein n=1 Tax=Coprinopsis marcescibilis TaxID=230819 RepID=A0A5C3KUY2_COPMA|nr:hypothetical protein FA15DRAFT_592734 [Coprinopsis marcescibilis]